MVYYKYSRIRKDFTNFLCLPYPLITLKELVALPRKNWKASGYSLETKKRTTSRWSDEKIAQLNRELAIERGDVPRGKHQGKKKKSRRF